MYYRFTAKNVDGRGFQQKRVNQEDVALIQVYMELNGASRKQTHFLLMIAMYYRFTAKNVDGRGFQQKCESRGCCFDSSIHGVKWCFKKANTFSTDDCHVPPIYREECGWAGISAETCESRGCCFDSSIVGVKWCFKKANTFSTDDCHVLPIYREECGWAGISAETCESRGCCFDSSIHGVKWCFKKANSQCAVLPNYRHDCGWPGISRETCETRGCCFNSNTPGTTWCFEKRENIDEKDLSDTTQQSKIPQSTIDASENTNDADDTNVDTYATQQPNHIDDPSTNSEPESTSIYEDDIDMSHSELTPGKQKTTETLNGLQLPLTHVLHDNEGDTTAKRPKTLAT
ncbi:TFF2 [Mytilus coruscus]|uniref:TFF2 n=1 Tax=Mytilus coruscus TaxID=42192 RepID=A0A6J8CL19_MYTCO|nr:TFF2 [Mytilus coruscus]